MLRICYTYVHNRSANKSLGGLTPFQKLTGRKPKITNFRRFGSLAVITKTKTNKRKQHKFGKRGELGFLIGIKSTGYKILMHKDYRIVSTKHVAFDESQVYGDYVGRNAIHTLPLTISEKQIFDCCKQSDDTRLHTDKVLNPPSNDEPTNTDHESTQELDDETEPSEGVFVPQ